MKEVNLGFLTQRPIDGKEICHEVFRGFDRFAPNLTPKRMSVEGLKAIELDSDSYLEQAYDFWGHASEIGGIQWQGERNGIEGAVGLNDSPLHSWMSMATSLSFVDASELQNIFLEWCRITTPDYAYLHAFSDAELKRGAYEELMPVRRGVLTPDVEEMDPFYAWMTLLGEPYVALLGRDTILSSPVFQVTEFAAGYFLLQLTDKMEALESSYDEICETREALKDHFSRCRPGISLRPNFFSS